MAWAFGIGLLDDRPDVIHKRFPIVHSFSTSTSEALALAFESDTSYKERHVRDFLSLEGKVTVVMGGARGIDLALARGCVEAGGDVAVLDSLSEAHADLCEMQKEFPNSKMQLYKQIILLRFCLRTLTDVMYMTDITSESVLTGTYEAVVKDFGPIDCWGRWQSILVFLSDRIN